VFVGPTRILLVGVALLAAMTPPAQGDGRAELVTCQALVERAAQAKLAGSAAAQQDDAALARCQQIVRDWTLRESRMSVDEQGRPLR
jgi:hypothetical protein